MYRSVIVGLLLMGCNAQEPEVCDTINTLARDSALEDSDTDTGTATAALPEYVVDLETVLLYAGNGETKVANVTITNIGGDAVFENHWSASEGDISIIWPSGDNALVLAHGQSVVITATFTSTGDDPLNIPAGYFWVTPGDEAAGVKRAQLSVLGLTF